jgi:hypothetical protein
MRFVILSFLLASSAVEAQSLFAPTPLFEKTIFSEKISEKANVQNASLILPQKPAAPLGGQLFRALNKGEMRLYEEKTGLLLSLKIRGTQQGNHAMCEVDFTPAHPLNISFIGNPQGVPRYYSKILGCDIFIDKHQDATIMHGGKCITPSGCEIDASGLWGDFSQQRNDKNIEKDRTFYETRMNNARKILMKAYKKSPHLSAFISEQLDFNAQRASLCAEHKGENLSYCGMKLTQARALALEARLNGAR